MSASVKCKNCLTTIHAKAIGENEYRCPADGCEIEICMLCGCTPIHACDGGCYWIREGLCSSHKKFLLSEIKRLFGKDAAAKTDKALAAYEEALRTAEGVPLT